MSAGCPYYSFSHVLIDLLNHAEILNSRLLSISAACDNDKRNLSELTKKGSCPCTCRPFGFDQFSLPTFCLPADQIVEIYQDC